MIDTTDPNSDLILDINNLKTYFFTERAIVRAVDGVNLTLPRKTTLVVVGESGCGKSIMAMSIMRLIPSPPGFIVDGHIRACPADRDGHADLAIGAPHVYFGPTKARGGAVQVLYGSHRGLTADGDQRWNAASVGGQPLQRDRFGTTLAAGDFDGDAIDCDRAYMQLSVGF